jgi:Cu/Ag efflux protein CusF
MRKPFATLALAAAIASGQMTAVLSQAVPADGEVVKIDESAGRITLRHGPIRNLDMDSMTMVFRVKEPAMLKAVKAGDRVTFEAERINGAITITRIQKAR